jgi:hypothetical protein
LGTFWFLCSLLHNCCNAAIIAEIFYIPPGGIEFEKEGGGSAGKFVIGCANSSTYVGEGTPKSKTGCGGRGAQGI